MGVAKRKRKEDSQDLLKRLRNSIASTQNSLQTDLEEEICELKKAQEEIASEIEKARPEINDDKVDPELFKKLVSKKMEILQELASKEKKLFHLKEAQPAETAALQAIPEEEQKAYEGQ